MHLATQQGSIHILACSLWFITVHNGGGTTQNTAEDRILPYGVRRGNEQPYGSTGQGLNTSVCIPAREKLNQVGTLFLAGGLRLGVRVG